MSIDGSLDGVRALFDEIDRFFAEMYSALRKMRYFRTKSKAVYFKNLSSQDIARVFSANFADDCIKIP